jgi:hypothetical protein
MRLAVVSGFLLILFNRFHTDMYGMTVHFPIPLDLFARFQPAAAYGIELSRKKFS